MSNNKVIEIEPIDLTGLPPQSAYHETTIQAVFEENQKLQDEIKLLQEKLRHKEEECRVVREMYHDCYNDYYALINAIKIINSIFKKSESSISK